MVDSIINDLQSNRFENSPIYSEVLEITKKATAKEYKKAFEQIYIGSKINPFLQHANAISESSNSSLISAFNPEALYFMRLNYFILACECVAFPMLQLISKIIWRNLSIDERYEGVESEFQRSQMSFAQAMHWCNKNLKQLSCPNLERTVKYFCSFNVGDLRNAVAHGTWEYEFRYKPIDERKVKDGIKKRFIEIIKERGTYNKLAEKYINQMYSSSSDRVNRIAKDYGFSENRMLKNGLVDTEQSIIRYEGKTNGRITYKSHFITLKEFAELFNNFVCFGKIIYFAFLRNMDNIRNLEGYSCINCNVTLLKSKSEKLSKCWYCGKP